MASNSSDVLVFGAIGFFSGLFLFGIGFKTLRRKRLIENTPTSKVRSLAMGPAEICGEALLAQGTLKSPFSGSPCVYYHYEVDEYRHSGKRSRWVTIKEGKSGVPFYLKDDTGEVLVDPNGAEVDIPSDFSFETKGRESMPGALIEFIRSEGIKTEGFFGFDKKLRFTENYLAPHDRIFVLGTAGDNPLVGEATSVKGVTDVMIQKGDKGRIYFISDKSEKECLKSHRISLFFEIYGGGAMAVVSLAYLLWKFNLF